MTNTESSGVGSWQATAATDATLDKVRALWASSQDESYPEEVREQYRTRAEALMFLHRITLAKAQQAGTNSDVPQWRNLVVCPAYNEFHGQYKAIVSALVEHVGVRGRFSLAGSQTTWCLEVVGFPSDLGYLEMLFTSCMMAFGGKLEPKWDPSLPLEENVYRMRSAGMERSRIARLAWPATYANHPSGYVNKALNIRVTAIFREMADKYGDDPSVLLGRGNNVATFRKSYAEAFVDELWSRLWRMRAARGNEARAVVLADVKNLVDEAFYTRYPYLRPRPPGPGDNGAYVAPNADCERCKIAKSGYCRAHQWLKPSKAKAKERPYSAAGAARGTVAAQSVDLGASGTAPIPATSDRRKIGN
jgi:hypothetical protein